MTPQATSGFVGLFLAPRSQPANSPVPYAPIFSVLQIHPPIDRQGTIETALG